MVHTASSTNWTSGVTPPVGYVAGPDIRLFADSSPFNTPIPGGTVWYDSPVLHVRANYGSTAGAPIEWYATHSPKVYFADENDPLWTFEMAEYIYAPANRNRAAQIITRRAPADMSSTAPESDRGVVVVDKVTGDYIEVWNCGNFDYANRIIRSGYVWDTSPNGSYPVGASGTVGWATGNVVTGPGAGTLGGQNDGVRAPNYSWAAGNVTGRDRRRHALGLPIDHALSVSLPATALSGASFGTSNYLYPATAIDFGYGWGPIKMGSRIGIPPGTTMPSQINAWPWGIRIWDCLQTYGAFVGDFIGGAWPGWTIERVDNPDWNEFIDVWENWRTHIWDLYLCPAMRVADYQPAAPTGPGWVP